MFFFSGIPYKIKFGNRNYYINLQHRNFIVMVHFRTMPGYAA